MVAVALAIGVSVALGVGAERRYRARAEAAARAVLGLMFWVLIPFVSFFSLARLHITGGVGVGLALGYTELSLVGVAAYLVGTRVLHLPRVSLGALICVVTLANTGYLGLPMTRALLGAHALAAAIAFDALVSGPTFYLSGFAIGAAFGARAGRGARERLETFVLRNPPLLSAVAGLLAPDRLAPDRLVHAAHSAVDLLLVLGFFALGVNLAAEAQEGALRIPPPLTPAVGSAIALRLLAAPALMLGLSAVTVAVPHAYLLEAAMPCGINSLVVAHAYGLDLKLTSSAVAWTTTLVVAAGLASVVLRA
jgi:malate permease and related proteins